MRTQIEHEHEFELITCSDTFILTYRYVPALWREELRQQLQSGNAGKVSKLNERINRLNEELQTELGASGKCFVSRTMLESTIYPGEITVLRAVLTNPWATHEDLGFAPE